MLVCKNCTNTFSGKFCNDCGQPGDTFKIDRHFVVHELRKTFIHLWDDGLFYTVKALFVNPGKTIKDYLAGKRIRHIKPFTFLILIGGTYVLMSQYFHISLFTNGINGHEVSELNHLLYTHYSQIQLLQLVVQSVFSVVFFSVKRYNFYEFLVVNTFLGAQRLLISVFTTIPLLALVKDPGYIKPMVYMMSIPGYALMIWTYCSLFDDQPALKVVLKTILVLLSAIFVTSCIISVAMLLI